MNATFLRQNKHTRYVTRQLLVRILKVKVHRKRFTVYNKRSINLCKGSLTERFSLFFLNISNSYQFESHFNNKK